MQKLQKLFNKSLHFIILILLIFIPLYQKFPLVRVSGTFVSVRLEDFIIFFAVILLLVKVISTGEYKELIKDNIIRILAVFIFVGALSLFSGYFLTHSLSIKIGIFHFLRRIELLSLLLLGIWAIDKKSQVRVYLFVSSLVLLLVNIYALGQKYFRFPVISTTNSELSKGIIYYLGEFDRVNSTFAGHYDLAIYLMMALIFTSGFAIYLLNKVKSSKDKNIWFSIFYLTVLSLSSGIILILTAARLSFIAVFVGIFTLLLLLKKAKLILIASIVAVVILLFPSQLRERFMLTITVNLQRSFNSFMAVSEEQEKRSQLNIPTLPSKSLKNQTWEGGVTPDIAPGEPTDSTQLAVYRSFEIRTKVEWPRAIMAFKKNPILGSGYSSLNLATDNDLLRSLGEVGIFGTYTFILLLFVIIRRIYRYYKKSKNFDKYLSAMILAMIVAFIFNSFLIDAFEASKVASLFWLATGIFLGYVRLGNKNDKYS